MPAPTLYTPIVPGAHFGHESFDAILAGLDRGITWYKGFAQLAAWTRLGAPAASISITGIPSIFRHLRLLALVRCSQAATRDDFKVTFNNDGGANYHYTKQLISTAITFVGTPGANLISMSSSILANTAPANHFSPVIMDIYNYSADVSGWRLRIYAHSSDVAVDMYTTLGAGLYRGTPPISSIQIFPGSANWSTGSAYALYGLDRGNV